MIRGRRKGKKGFLVIRLLLLSVFLFITVLLSVQYTVTLMSSYLRVSSPHGPIRTRSRSVTPLVLTPVSIPPLSHTFLILGPKPGCRFRVETVSDRYTETLWRRDLNGPSIHNERNRHFTPFVMNGWSVPTKLRVNSNICISRVYSWTGSHKWTTVEEQEKRGGRDLYTFKRRQTQGSSYDKSVVWLIM